VCPVESRRRRRSFLVKISRRRRRQETTNVEFLNQKFTKKCLKFVNIGQEMTFFEAKISKFSRPNFFTKLWTVLFLSFKFFLKNSAL